MMAGKFTKEEIEQQIRSQMLIWLVLMMSIILFGVVLYVIVLNTKASPMEPLFNTMISITAGVIGLISLGLFFFGMSKKWLKNDVSLSKEEKETELYNVTLKINLLFLINLSLNESIAIFGFLLGIFEGKMSFFYPFAGAAIVLNLVMQPIYGNTLEKVTRMLRL